MRRPRWPGAQVMAYLFNDYWEDIGTIKSFFEANLALAQQVRLAPGCPCQAAGWLARTCAGSAWPASAASSPAHGGRGWSSAHGLQAPLHCWGTGC